MSHGFKVSASLPIAREPQLILALNHKYECYVFRPKEFLVGSRSGKTSKPSDLESTMSNEPLHKGLPVTPNLAHVTGARSVKDGVRNRHRDRLSNGLVDDGRSRLGNWG
jgi:hypothetical protein